MPTSPPPSNSSSAPDSTAAAGDVFRLVLMRHAKSDWAEADLCDHDRPLNDRGIRDTPSMARWIADAGFLPDVILCSSATRTQQTAALLQSYWENIQLCRATLHVIPELYLASDRTILKLVSRIEPPPPPGSREQTVLVLGHNPGISEAAAELVGYPVGLSTAAVMALRCDIPSWSTSLTGNNTELIGEMKPKSLPGEHR